MPDVRRRSFASPARRPPCRPDLPNVRLRLRRGRNARREVTDFRLRLRLEFALEAPDMFLRIQFEPDPPDQIQLRLEEVDMMLLVLHQALEQVAGNVILDAVTVGRGLRIQRARSYLGGKIAFDDFLDVLP